MLQQWLDVCFITPPNLVSHWMCWYGTAAFRKDLKRGMSLIWHTAVWAIWNARNNVIFNNGVFRADEVVEFIQVLSWKWSLARLKMPACLLYEWKWNPTICLCRKQ